MLLERGYLGLSQNAIPRVTAIVVDGVDFLQQILSSELRLVVDDVRNPYIPKDVLELRI